jgi:hypothetical protein|tara:strand:- start:288 stop:482 length:195 start_codon:yes stop_codon:yes gene_type:complete
MERIMLKKDKEIIPALNKIINHLKTEIREHDTGYIHTTINCLESLSKEIEGDTNDYGKKQLASQ